MKGLQKRNLKLSMDLMEDGKLFYDGDEPLLKTLTENDQK